MQRAALRGLSSSNTHQAASQASKDPVVRPCLSELVFQESSHQLSPSLLRTIIFTNDEKQKRKVEEEGGEGREGGGGVLTPTNPQHWPGKCAEHSTICMKAEFVSNALMSYRVPLGAELVIWRHTGSVPAFSLGSLWGKKLSSEESRQGKPSPCPSFTGVSALEPGSQGAATGPREMGWPTRGLSQHYSVLALPRPWARREVPVQVRGICSAMWGHPYLYILACVAAGNEMY